MEGDLLGLDFGETPAAPPQQQAAPPPPAQVPTQTPAPAPAAAAPAPAPAPTTAPDQTAATLPVSQSSTSAPAAATQAAQNATTNSSNGAANNSSANAQTKSQPGTVWKPVTAQDEEPTDPILKEIKQKFGGRWKLVRTDPYGEYLKAVGVGIFTRKVAATGMPEQHVTVRGDKIHISLHSTFHNQIYVFQLNDSVENLVEKTRQSVFCSYREGKLILQMTPLDPGFGKTQEVERSINEMGELVVIYTSGSAVCRRYFAKLPDLAMPPEVIG